MSARELAEAIGGLPTQSTIENIELGRKVSVDVVHLLNIAMATKVPLSFLLAPLGDPSAALDLQGLSHEFDGMTSIEFDAWLGSVPEGAHKATTIEERNAVAELQALRAWHAQSAETRRLEAALELERVSSLPTQSGYVRSTEERLSESHKESNRLARWLRSAGWEI